MGFHIYILLILDSSKGAGVTASVKEEAQVKEREAIASDGLATNFSENANFATSSTFNNPVLAEEPEKVSTFSANSEVQVRTAEAPEVKLDDNATSSIPTPGFSSTETAAEPGKGTTKVIANNSNSQVSDSMPSFQSTDSSYVYQPPFGHNSMPILSANSNSFNQNSGNVSGEHQMNVPTLNTSLPLKLEEEQQIPSKSMSQLQLQSNNLAVFPAPSSSQPTIPNAGALFQGNHIQQNVLQHHVTTPLTQPNLQQQDVNQQFTQDRMQQPIMQGQHQQPQPPTLNHQQFATANMSSYVQREQGQNVVFTTNVGGQDSTQPSLKHPGSDLNDAAYFPSTSGNQRATSFSYAPIISVCEATATATATAGTPRQTPIQNYSFFVPKQHVPSSSTETFSMTNSTGNPSTINPLSQQDRNSSHGWNDVPPIRQRRVPAAPRHETTQPLSV